MKTYFIILGLAALVLATSDSAVAANAFNEPIRPLEVGIKRTNPSVRTELPRRTAPGSDFARFGKFTTQHAGGAALIAGSWPTFSGEDNADDFIRIDRKRSLVEPAGYVMIVHAIGMAMLVSMDPAETGFKPMHVRNWADGMTSPPIWDDDSWITNFILHPLWGSETYLRSRSANYSPFESFLFSTAASVLWEYGFESWAEHPSRQDLLVTSTAGSLIGELRYMARMELMEHDAAWATVLLILVDPFHMMMKHSALLVGGASRKIASALLSDVSVAPSLSSAPGGEAAGELALKVSVKL